MWAYIVGMPTLLCRQVCELIQSQEGAVVEEVKSLGKKRRAAILSLLEHLGLDSLCKSLAVVGKEGDGILQLSHGGVLDRDLALAFGTWLREEKPLSREDICRCCGTVREVLVRVLAGGKGGEGPDQNQEPPPPVDVVSLRGYRETLRAERQSLEEEQSQGECGALSSDG